MAAGNTAVLLCEIPLEFNVVARRRQVTNLWMIWELVIKDQDGIFEFDLTQIELAIINTARCDSILQS
jgi:hypothetical protein